LKNDLAGSCYIIKWQEIKFLRSWFPCRAGRC